MSKYRVIRMAKYYHLHRLERYLCFGVWRVVAKGGKAEMIALGKRKGKEEVVWEG